MIANDYPKILIISHNLFDESNNIGKTLVSLLRGWPKDKIAQIYFRNDNPSFEFCSQYYCITDKDILKSVASFNLIKPGAIINSKNAVKRTSTETKLYNIGNQRHPIVSLMRDTIWNIGNWKNEKLKDWLLNEVKPDYILFVPNDYTLAYNVALWVQKIVQKPIVPYYMDDAFYFNSKGLGIVDNIRRKRIQQLGKEVNKDVTQILTICDYMSDEYSKKFQKPCKSFLNSVEIKEPKPIEAPSNPLIFSYIGNLHSNRWQSIVDIAKTLKHIEKLKGQKSEIRIYSSSYYDERMRKAFSSLDNIKFLGKIHHSLVRERQLESDILLHVEAFDKKSMASTKLSLSTKIPECLSSGVPLFAYGPKAIASMRYLKENDLAQVCSDRIKLFDCLSDLLDNPSRLSSLSIKGYKQTIKKHDILKNSKEFQDIFKNYEI